VSTGKLHDAKIEIISNQEHGQGLRMGHLQSLRNDDDACATTSLDQFWLDSSPESSSDHQSQVPKTPVYRIDDVVPGFASLSDLLNPGDFAFDHFDFSASLQVPTISDN